jgi:hypothetical protein
VLGDLAQRYSTTPAISQQFQSKYAHFYLIKSSGSSPINIDYYFGENVESVTKFTNKLIFEYKPPQEFKKNMSKC